MIATAGCNRCAGVRVLPRGRRSQRARVLIKVTAQETGRHGHHARNNFSKTY